MFLTLYYTLVILLLSLFLHFALVDSLFFLCFFITFSKFNLWILLFMRLGLSDLIRSKHLIS